MALMESTSWRFPGQLLLLMLAGTHCYFVVIVILRMKAILAERRIVSLQLRQAAREAG